MRIIGSGLVRVKIPVEYSANRNLSRSTTPLTGRQERGEKTTDIPSRQEKEPNEESKVSLDREAACDGCHNTTTRGKIKESKLCEDCRRKIGMNW